MFYLSLLKRDKHVKRMKERIKKIDNKYNGNVVGFPITLYIYV